MVTLVRTAVAAALVAGACSSVAAAEFRPLSEVAASESSDAISYYVATRCSAAYLAAADNMRIDGGAENQSLTTQLASASDLFFKVAQLLALENEMAVDATAIEGNVREMATMYFDEMRLNYLATGNRFEGLVAGDITFCSALT